MRFRENESHQLSLSRAIKDWTLIGAYDRQDHVFREVGLRFGGQPCLVRFMGDEKDRDGLR